MRSSDRIKYPRNTNGMWPKPMIGGLWISLFQRWFKPVNIRCCIQEGSLQTFRMLDYLSSFLPIERKHLGNFWGKFPTGCAVPAFPVTRLCRLLLPLPLYCSHCSVSTILLPLYYSRYTRFRDSIPSTVLPSHTLVSDTWQSCLLLSELHCFVLSCIQSDAGPSEKAKNGLTSGQNPKLT